MSHEEWEKREIFMLVKADPGKLQPFSVTGRA
jgi:hypothetical protein